jgi:hypothetical protein
MRFLRVFFFSFIAFFILLSVSIFAQANQKYLLVLNKNEASLTILDPDNLLCRRTAKRLSSPITARKRREARFP